MADRVHDGHRQRLKARFLSEGLRNFDAHVVLELLLFFGIPQKDTNELAHKLLQQFGSIAGVFDAPYEELIKIDGIGPAAATLLHLIPDLSQRYLDEKYSEKFIISSTKDAGELLLHRYSCINTETLMLMLLDGKGRQLFCGTVMEGSIHSLDISIKSIVKIASRYQASAAIIAHNHPSGIALPSSEDLNTTEAVQQALELLHIRLLDHIIIADRDYVSMADSGLIDGGA